MGVYSVFYECKKCSFRTTTDSHPMSEPIPNLECGNCGESVSWNRLVVNRQEKKESNLPNFIPVMHSWFDPGAKRVFTGRKAAEQYAKETGRLWANDKELEQEADHNNEMNEKERHRSAMDRSTESINRVLHKHGLKRY